MEVNSFLGFIAVQLTVAHCNWTRCTHLPESDTVDCSGRHFDKISLIARLDASKFDFYPNTISSRVRLLNLSRNGLKSISPSSFSLLRYPEVLEILDLSHNKLMFISPAAFKGLSHLKILLLNDNQLHALNRSSFVELKSLEELNLDSNPLSSFPDRTFAALTKLRKLSIMSNQLSCDCQMADLLRFINKDGQVQVSNRTTCIFPHSLRGVQIASLNVKALKRSCGKGFFDPAIFELEPSSRLQIVYPGTEKNLTCNVSRSEDVYMEWLKNNVPVVPFSRLTISRYNDSQFLYLKLSLSPVTWEDEGDWICYVEQGGSMLRNGIRMTPVLVNTAHCVQEWQADEKGEIVWPISKQGLVAAKCPNGPVHAKAYRRCKYGRWEMPDTGHCNYASPFIKHFLTLLQHGQTSVYVHDLLRTNKRPAELSAYETRLAGWIIANSTGSSSRQILAALNFVLQSKFARTELNGELMRFHLQQLLLGDEIIQEKTIALCQHLLFAKGHEETGTGTVKAGFLASHDGARFLCREQQLVELLPATGGTSLRIPRTTIDQFSSVTIVRVLWLANSNIFKSKHTSDGRWTVINEVYGVAVKQFPLKSSKFPNSHPEQLPMIVRNDDFYGFYVSYRVNEAVDQVQLGVWDDEEGWKLTNPTSCLLQRVGPNYILFTCSRRFFDNNVGENIAYFAAMHNASHLELLKSGKVPIKLAWWTYASFGFLASAVLSTAAINLCSLCLSKNRSRRRQQVIANMCISIFVLCTLYSITASGTSNPEKCRTIGLAQHFFFLAVYFWIMEAFGLLREKLGRVVRDDDQSRGSKKIRIRAEKVAVHGAIMKMYFIAYGIPLFALSTVVATDALSDDRLSKFCFPSPTLHMKILTCAIFAPLSICVIVILGTVISILRLLIKAKRLTIERIFRQHLDDKGSEGSSSSSGHRIAPPELLCTDASSAASQLLLLLSVVLLYSLGCYTAAIYINQLNNAKPFTAELYSYFSALFNVLLAVSIFCAFTVEPAGRTLRQVCVSSRTACVPDSVVNNVPQNCKVEFSRDYGTTVPLLQSSGRPSTVVAYLTER